MAVLWLGTGTASISRTETAMLTGTATPSYLPDVYVTGTAVVDRNSVAAWAAAFRRTATRVLLGEEGEDMLRIQGPVEVARDDGGLIATASFTVTDPRCAFFHADSIVTGGIPVVVRCRIATDLAEADTAIFRGVTEAAPSTGDYVPTATIQCAGEGAEWLTAKACASVPAFSGKTYLEILGDFAESVGIARTRIIGGEHWGTPRLGFDLSGLSTYDLAQRFALLHDHYLRLSGADLEIVPASQIVGPAAVTVFDFEQGDYISAAETPPNRPVSKLVLSTIGVSEETLGATTEETTAALEVEIAPDLTRTETRTYTTTVGGIVVRQRIEVWKDAAIPGVSPSAVAFRLWKLVETTTTWGTTVVDGRTLRTARVDSERTVTTEWYSAPCRSSSGSVWSDGTRHIDASASWQVTEDRVTSYSYDSACTLVSKTVNVGQWYSPLVASGHTYDDGKIRADISYQWTAADAAQPTLRDTEVNAEESGDTLNAVTVVTRSYGWHVPPGSAVQAEEWSAISGRDDRWSTVPGSGLVMHAWTEYREDGSVYSKAEPADSMVQLARASASIPQYKTVPIVLEAIADSASPLSEPAVDTPWGAETTAHLENVARHRFREERSPRHTIAHWANPHLRQLDVVGVTDPTWQHDLRRGLIRGFRMSLDSSTTGGLREESVVMFPLPAYNPGAALVTA